MRRKPAHRAGCEPAECDKSRTHRHVGLLEDPLRQLHRSDNRHARDQAQEGRARAQRSNWRVLMLEMQAMAPDLEVANADAALGEAPKCASIPSIWCVIAPHMTVKESRPRRHARGAKRRHDHVRRRAGT